MEKLGVVPKWNLDDFSKGVQLKNKYFSEYQTVNKIKVD
jgi:hypothetical protein